MVIKILKRHRCKTNKTKSNKKKKNKLIYFFYFTYLMKYLKQFVVGSSCLVFLPFYYSVLLLDKSKRNFLFENYVFLAPFWFGLFNMLSLYLSEQFNLNYKQRFQTISLLSYLFILTIVTNTNAYNFNKNDWIKYIIILGLLYYLTWNYVIYYIEKYI